MAAENAPGTTAEPGRESVGGGAGVGAVEGAGRGLCEGGVSVAAREAASRGLSADGTRFSILKPKFFIMGQSQVLCSLRAVSKQIIHLPFCSRRAFFQRPK